MFGFRFEWRVYVRKVKQQCHKYKKANKYDKKKTGIIRGSKWIYRQRINCIQLNRPSLFVCLFELLFNFPWKRLAHLKQSHLFISNVFGSIYLSKECALFVWPLFGGSHVLNVVPSASHRNHRIKSLIGSEEFVFPFRCPFLYLFVCCFETWIVPVSISIWV